MVKSIARPALLAVIDDDHAMCRAISSLLRSEGYRCAVFGSAEAFLQSGKLTKTDCVLLDVCMSGMDGLDFQLTLRQIHSRLPVIYVTAVCDRCVLDRAIRGGAVALFGKPFDSETLLAAIRRALNGPAPAGGATPQSDCRQR